MIDPTMLEKRSALIARHLEAENAHQLEKTLGTLTVDCRFEDHALGKTLLGHSGAESYYRLWWEAFEVVVDRAPEQAGLRWTLDGDAVAEAQYIGRHVGPFLGIAPTGRAIKLPFVVIVTFRDGLMAGERFYYDLAGLLRQLNTASEAAVAIDPLPYSSPQR